MSPVHRQVQERSIDLETCIGKKTLRRQERGLGWGQTTRRDSAVTGLCLKQSISSNENGVGDSAADFPPVTRANLISPWETVPLNITQKQQLAGGDGVKGVVCAQFTLSDNRHRPRSPHLPKGRDGGGGLLGASGRPGLGARCSEPPQHAASRRCHTELLRKSVSPRSLHGPSHINAFVTTPVAEGTPSVH